MRKLSLRLLLSYLGAMLLVAGVTAVYVHYRFKSYFLETTTQDLYRAARLIGAALDPTTQSGGHLDELCRKLRQVSSYRVTVLSTEGMVLGDSEVPSSSMENHLFRAEIQAALQNGQGYSIRTSTTLGYSLLYTAVQVKGTDCEYVIRLAVPMKLISAHLSAIRWSACAAGMLGFVLAAPFVYLYSQHVSRRIGRLKGFLRDAVYGPSSRRLYVASNDELGEFERELEQATDAFQRRLAELSVERIRFRQLIEALPEGILVLDNDNKILMANPAAEAMVGNDRQSLTGKAILDVVRSYALFELLDEKSRGTSVCASKEVLLQDGSHRAYQTMLMVVREPTSGARIGSILRLRDISEEKRLERIRAGFISDVSHQLRTPLTLIKGYVETLQAEGFQDTTVASHYLSIIAESTDAVIRIVNGLVRLSAIELGKLPVRKEPVPIKELVDKVTRTFSLQAEQKGISLENTISDDLPPALADHDRLLEALVTIYDNAVKYTPRGHITASASYLLMGEHYTEPRISLSVSDTGIGIPANEIERVTERFYRCQRHSAEGDSGSGLGLAIVKHLVRLMDGTLSITSTEGRGTTVTITLPAGGSAAGLGSAP